MGCCQSYDLKPEKRSEPEETGPQFFEVDLGVDGLFEQTVSEESPRMRGSVRLNSVKKLHPEIPNGRSANKASQSEFAGG